MRQIYAYFATEWLEKHLLPLALQAVGLPAETDLGQLEALALPCVNDEEIPFYANAEAGTLCTQRPLFCAVMLAESFVHHEQAWRIIRAIYGLMWRDGVEYALARDLDMALNNEWFSDGEAARRMDRAEQAWERWQQTDAAALASQQDFLTDCVDQRLAAFEPLQPGGGEQVQRSADSPSDSASGHQPST
ncbi:MAG: hypothetical protein CVV27_05595 [Candidatus Melainabacteria bacterium HGW-Melainabacteria-1]|nr:MAG: hypothetical protein CVV27_05595 [Candidatus Melainabacteria bacterium HGW-Melainabacteria-1]